MEKPGQLPDDRQKMGLAELISLAFVELRFLGSDARGPQASDLADAFHNVAREMLGWGKWDPNAFRQQLTANQGRHHVEAYPGRID